MSVELLSASHMTCAMNKRRWASCVGKSAVLALVRAPECSASRMRCWHSGSLGATHMACWKRYMAARRTVSSRVARFSPRQRALSEASTARGVSPGRGGLACKAKLFSSFFFLRFFCQTTSSALPGARAVAGVLLAVADGRVDAARLPLAARAREVRRSSRVQWPDAVLRSCDAPCKVVE